jgi:hypothetical protein
MEKCENSVFLLEYILIILGENFGAFRMRAGRKDGASRWFLSDSAEPPGPEQHRI